jgi:protein-S-isoprenylcysteine O-methyltransferase Ste14
VTIPPTLAVRYAWTGWIVSWLLAALWSSRAERRPPRETEIVYRAITVVGTVLLFGVHPRWGWAAMQLWNTRADLAWFLVAITLLGFAVAWWARIALGRLWSSGVTVKADHDMITAGPYRFVRHPIYSGLLLSVFATAVLFATGAAAVGAAAIIVGAVIKARIEEQFLRSQLGDERYTSYARRVPMLVPFMRPGAPARLTRPPAR